MFNVLRFHKEKCEVLHLGRINPRHQYMLGSKELESHLAENNLGGLLDTRLNTSQWCISVAKRLNGILGYMKSLASRLREVIRPLPLALVRSHLEYWVQFLGHQYEKDRDILDKSSKGSQSWLWKDRGISPMMRLREPELCGLEKRRLRGTSSIYWNT